MYQHTNRLFMESFMLSQSTTVVPSKISSWRSINASSKHLKHYWMEKRASELS